MSSKSILKEAATVSTASLIPSSGILQRQCQSCGHHKLSGEPCSECTKKPLQRKAVNSATIEDTSPMVGDVLRSPGQPLDPQTRTLMESRFQQDFSRVRVHTNAQAAASARSVNALAYTIGQNVVFDAGQYAPKTRAGRYLLAHELTHTLQQRQSDKVQAMGRSFPSRVIGRSSDSAETEANSAAQAVARNQPVPFHPTPVHPVLQRFEKSERDRIAKFDAVLGTAETIANASADYATIDWGDFVKNAGGMGASDYVKKAGKKVGVNSKIETKSLPNRYLLTCRCGLLDMRHFYQLMYITRFYRDAPFFTSNEGANRTATHEGREHELKAEETSRFAPEDTPSNALGAYFGSQLSGSQSPKEFVQGLRAYLRTCLPVDFSSLPAAEQDMALNYYGDRTAAGTPVHQNETATPAALPLSVCSGKSQAFPFEVAPTDTDKKTLSGTKQPYSLTSDSDIRDWVNSKSDTEIDDLPDWEKIRLLNRLLNGWVSDDDVTAFEKICRSVKSGTEMAAIKAAVSPRIKSLSNSQQSQRVTNALNRVP